MSDNAQLEKVYDPKQVERDMFALWERHEAFRALPDDRPPDRRFVVMIPLPNVTGALHLGHAINNSLQDIMTRWHRMRGFNSLYQPGTDHAGIATQATVERRILEEEGKNRHDLGRDELVRRIWAWKDDYEARILDQLKMMGCSCDWQRVRFTLDEKYSDSVHETFFRWFSAGLVYRGVRLVNWDTQLRTAVADDEVYHETFKGHFWHFKYPIKDPPPGGPAHLGFATTRPETMLGDTALAVNPADKRYETLVGKTALIPLFDPPREIPIIADEWADPGKGTGCVKITPAHDANDYEVGLRHNLPMINIMTPDGQVNTEGGKYAGQTMLEARPAVVADMEELGLLDRVDDLDVDLPHSDRSKSPIEPFLSQQWFVQMGDVPGDITLGDGTKASGLAQAAMDAVTNGRVRIVPERYTKTYLDWLSEKRDWCISRQLWWGHRIPVWTRRLQLTESNWTEAFLGDGMDSLLEGNWAGSEDMAVRIIHVDSGELVTDWRNAFFPVTKETEGEYEFCVCLRQENRKLIDLLDGAGFVRDADVLDTWFSSQLWPFATIGWPEKTADLDYYYPGTVLITSRDIITLWVARMVLSGLYNVGDIPFRDVYIHPKILDGRGETMSKTKGNGVDPLDIIEAYGADAMRYSLADMTTETQDFRLPVDYRCPHCGELTPQTAQNMKARSLTCARCKKTFATRWADQETMERAGLAGMVSDKFEIGRNFCNKLWNAARFAFMNLEGVPCEPLDVGSLPTEDRWILAKLSQTARRLHEELSAYRYSASIKLLRDFFWDSLCDWYIELSKARMHGGEHGAEAKQILAFCLDQILRLLHPFIPFITERLWGQLNAVAPQRGLPGIADLRMNDLLITTDFPPADGWPGVDDPAVIQDFETLQDATRGVRDLRSRNNVPPKQKVTVTVKVPPDRVEGLKRQASIVQRLAGVPTLHVASDAARPKNAGTIVAGSMQIYVHDIADDQAERKRLEKEMAAVDQQISAKEGKLSNEKFVNNAKPEVVDAERARLVALREHRETLAQSLALLS